MGRFLTSLDARLIGEGPPSLWTLLAPLVYHSDLPGVGLVVAPVGMETDFASVPRLPLIYLMAGGTCDRPAVLHDYLYSPPFKFDRETCDRVLLEAAESVNVAPWRRNMVYAGVRVGGDKYFQREAP